MIFLFLKFSSPFYVHYIIPKLLRYKLFLFFVLGALLPNIAGLVSGSGRPWQWIILENPFLSLQNMVILFCIPLLALVWMMANRAFIVDRPWEAWMECLPIQRFKKYWLHCLALSVVDWPLWIIWCLFVFSALKTSVLLRSLVWIIIILITQILGRSILVHYRFTASKRSLVDIKRAGHLAILWRMQDKKNWTLCFWLSLVTFIAIDTAYFIDLPSTRLLIITIALFVNAFIASHRFSGINQIWQSYVFLQSLPLRFFDYMVVRVLGVGFIVWIFNMLLLLSALFLVPTWILKMFFVFFASFVFFSFSYIPHVYCKCYGVWMVFLSMMIFLFFIIRVFIWF